MSLVVWLPMNRDLRNQGLSNVTVTNNGATYSSTGGKLGGCYTFDGNDYIRISMPSEMTTLKGTSVAAWVKSTSSTLALGGISNDVNYTVPMCTLYTSGWQFGNDAQNGYRYISGGTIANTNTWHHVCCTVSDTTITTYLDGVQVTSGAISGVTTFTSANFIEIGCDHPGGDEYLTGSVNDFRVYDHTLSQMEVKELSKGLILHYPLNRGGWGQENLAHNTYNLAPFSTSQVEFKAYDVGLLDVSDGETVTISFDLDMTVATGGSGYLLVYNTNYPGPHQITNGNVLSERTLVAGQDIHERISYTTTMTTRSSPSYSTDRIEFYSNYSTENEIQISNIKIERGNTATPWCPNSSDAFATTMGLNGTTEYDCSGFCNNGTRTGTFSWTSDTPKYSVSSTFGSTSTKIHISNLSTSGFGNSYSFAWWGKTPSWSGLMQWGFSDGIRFNGIYNGNLWNTGDGSNNPIYKPNTTTQITVPSINVWHHYVMTGDGTTNKLYVDGELYGTSKTYKGISGTSIYLNGWDSGTTYCHSNYQMSDFRIYATALSADDVKALYQNSAYIDSNGNVYGAVHSEV